MENQPPWRSPGQIDADVARLQDGIRQARADADSLAPAGPGARPRDDAAYREAVTRVSRATRTLVDYEASIPQLIEGHRQRLGTLLAGRSGGLLALVGAGLGGAAGFGAIPLWWLFPVAVIVITGLATMPGARRRAADPDLRPHLGAVCYALGGADAVVCATGVVPPEVLLSVFALLWLGLRLFRVLALGDVQVQGPQSARQSNTG